MHRLITTKANQWTQRVVGICLSSHVATVSPAQAIDTPPAIPTEESTYEKDERDSTHYNLARMREKKGGS